MAVAENTTNIVNLLLLQNKILIIKTKKKFLKPLQHY